jgi:hypothetical protein
MTFYSFQREGWEVLISLSLDGTSLSLGVYLLNKKFRPVTITRKDDFEVTFITCFCSTKVPQ